jgi:Acetyltransferase (GNAT) family.
MLTSKINEDEVDYNVSESFSRDIYDNEIKIINVNILYNGEEVGYLMFSVDENNQKLFIENIEVWEVYRNQGIGQLLYKKFGELYRNNYNGWIVEREFQNPIAEQAFMKAIEKGWVPQEAFNEQTTKRTY